MGEALRRVAMGRNATLLIREFDNPNALIPSFFTLVVFQYLTVKSLRSGERTRGQRGIIFCVCVKLWTGQRLPMNPIDDFGVSLANILNR